MSDKTENQQESLEKETVGEAKPLVDENTPNNDSTSESQQPLSEEENLRAQLAELNDKFVRLYSEFDNFRKRTAKERLELIKSAASDLVISMLPVLDDFERAMKFSQNQEGDAGVTLIYQKLKSTLEAKGLKRMESIGKEFDADLHEAITNVPAASEEMKGKVVDEAECGYFFNEKVIRFAKVIVGA